MKTKSCLLLPLFLTIFPIISQAQETERIYLSGRGFDDAVEWRFMCTEGRKSGKWSTIPVPSCWELHGYGKYNYGHDPEEERGKESGLYELTFNVPQDWQGHEINIFFEGIMTDAEVMINGKLAGPKHKGAFYKFGYDISKLIRIGEENILEVKVDKHSSDESVNDAERRSDYWIFGGIFRPVYLEIKPMENINRVAVDARADGSFDADIYFNKLKDGRTLEIQLYDLDGQPVGEISRFPIGKNKDMMSVSTRFKEVVPWNPEFPQLYEIELRLISKEDIIHSIKERIGFRTIEVRERDGIYVNGIKVRLKGVCRHSFWPETGRTLNKSLSIQDVNLMKEMNMNAVRMSHYPPDEHFLDVCDSLGLFVLDELAGWQASYNTEIGKKLVKEMVIRDVNHPSIIIWDNGNEGGWNTDLDDEFERFDPQKRIVIHPWENFRRTDTNHYIDYNYGTHDGFNGTEIFFPTEFLHGLFDGGLGAGLEDFWDLIISRPRAAGGFLWVFSDEAVVRTDMNGELDTDGNHAPDGILGPHREKEGSYFTIKEIWSPVYFKDRLITGNFDGVFEIENRYFYTNLSSCSFFYEFVRFPGPYKSQEDRVIINSGQITSPEIAPGQEGLLTIDLPENWYEADVLYIKALDPRGMEIYTWDWAISLPERYASTIIGFESADPASVMTERTETVEFSANEIQIIIDKQSGYLKSVRNGDILIPISEGPKLAEGKSEIKSYKIFSEGKNQIYEAEYSGNQKLIRWTLYNNGLLKLNFIYYPDNNQLYYGINFNFPEDNINGIKWLGKGPYRVWKNRLKGVTLNIWEKKYNNTITGESYDYPEFKGYHASLYWVTLQNKVHDFKVFTTNENMYLRLYTPGIPKADPRYTQVEFPDGDISFLNAINPVGTKFKSPEKLGPQSQLNMYRRHRNDGNMEIELIFDFR
jgi:hypothetical protein